MIATYKIPDTWQRCYEDNWNGLITPESFSHPAKYSRGLISRIYVEMMAAGMLEAGDTVADPFGGIAGGGIIAAGLGLRWFGCELEYKFWKLGNQNIEMHRKLWEQFGDPVPVLVNGDSRQLRKHLQGPIAAVVSSPPFAASQSGGGLALPGAVYKDGTKIGTNCGYQNQAFSGGNLANMPQGSIDSIVSSPPYAESLRGDNSEQETASESREKRVTPGGSLGQSARHAGYGGPNNLGNLPAGDVSAIVGSPPYEGQFTQTGGGIYARGEHTKCLQGNEMKYGESAGNVGNESGETFWHAARDITRECFEILKPGGHAVWVVKAFVRNKSIVDFPGDWRKLCEACGFEFVQECRAMLVNEERHPDLFGGEEHVKTTKRASFFRRLYEKKYPHNAIDWEVVLFMRKPA